MTVTAQSVLGEKHADATITYKEAKPFEKIHFIKKSFEVTADNNGMNLYSFVNVDEHENPEDDFIFTSSNPETIGISGIYLRLYKPDTVTITVRSKRNPDKAIDTCEVTYKATSLNSIWFTADVPTKVTQGVRFNLWNYINTDPYYYAHSLDGDTTYRQNIKFKAVSDPQIVNFEQDGAVVYGRFPGKTTIIAVYDDGKNHIESAPFTLEVVPVPVEKIVFAKESKFEIKQGKTIDLSDGKYLTLKPYNAVVYYDNKTWTTSDPEIVSLDGSEATGVKAGTATVTLSIRNTDGSLVEGSCEITVKDTALEGIAFKKKEYTANLSGSTRYEDDYEYNDANEKTLYLKLTPADADIDWNDIHIESSNPEIARIAEYGVNDKGAYCMVKAVKPGKVTITASSRANEKIKATTKVTVKPVEIKSVKFEQKIENAKRKIKATVFGGGYGSITVEAKLTPADAYCEAKWETSDASVAYIDGTTFNGSGSKKFYQTDGIISKDIVLAGPGTCTIKLTVTDGKNTKTRSFKVTVTKGEVSKLMLNKTAATAYLIKDGDNTLQLEAYDSKTNYAVPVTWTSANKKIATVDRFGMVTFKKTGKVKITATTKDGNKTKKTCTLTIKKLNVKQINVTKAISMKPGFDKALKVNVLPANAYNPKLSFKSSKPSVVTVDKDGNLFALAPGRAVITITATDGSKKSAKVNVTVKAVANNNDIAIGEIAGNDAELTIEGFEMDGITDISGTGIDGEINLTIE